MATRDQHTDVSVHLESIVIEGYRSCRETNFSPNSDLSVLIGINGAGKTNVLQGVRLLDSKRVHGRRSGLSISAPEGTARVTAWFRVNDLRIGLRIVFTAVEGNRRSDEMVAIDESWNLASFTGSKAWRPMPPAGLLRHGPKGLEVGRQLIFFDGESDGVRYRGRQFGKFDTSIFEHEAAVEALLAVAEFREGISYYSASQFTDPSRCPSSFEVNEEGRLNESFLTSSGGVHLRFLHDLYRLRSDNPDLYEEYCRFVSRHQLGLVSRLTWKEIELSSSTAEVRSGGSVQKIRKRKTLVIPKVQVGSAHITFNQLSEGTFKTLALAFYIVTDASKFLMVEEPEVCVHHGLLSRIVGTIKGYSHRKQTIISTHSDLLVDELEPRHLYVVEMSPNGTKVKGLETWLSASGKRALRTYLAESGPLGEYWRTGGLT